jgi:hypothetical protein
MRDATSVHLCYVHPYRLAIDGLLLCVTPSHDARCRFIPAATHRARVRHITAPGRLVTTRQRHKHSGVLRVLFGQALHEHHWSVLSFAQVCQCLAGLTMSWVEPPPADRFDDLFMRIGSPSVEGTRRCLEYMLREFADKLAHRVHANLVAIIDGPQVYRSDARQIQRLALAGHLWRPA